MQRKLVVLFIIAAAASLGCQGEAGAPGLPGKEGAPGGSCTLATEGESSTLQCPEGELSLVPPGACTLESAAGSHTLRCGEAAPVVIQDGESIRAGITGVARLFGVPPGEGIEVELLGEDQRTTTDAEGRFEFRGLAAGLYRLGFSAPGYMSAEIGDVVAVGRVVDVGEAALKIGRRVGDAESYLVWSPDGRFAALEEWDEKLDLSRLSLLELETFQRRELRAGDSFPIHFLDDRHIILIRYWPIYEIEILDTQSGEIVHLAEIETYRLFERGLLYTLADPGDGPPSRFVAPTSLEVIPLEARVWGSSSDVAPRYLLLRDPSETEFLVLDSAYPEELIPVASRYIAYGGGGKGSLAYFAVDEEVTYIEMRHAETGMRERLGPASGANRLGWSPGDRSLAAFTYGSSAHPSSLRLYEPGVGLVEEHETSRFYALSFSPSGAKILLNDNENSRVYELDTGNEWAAFDGSRLAWSGDERWYASWRAGNLILQDTSVAAPEGRVDLGGGEDFFFHQGELIYAQDDELVRRQLSTGEEQRIPMGSLRLLRMGEIVAFLDREGAISLLDLADDSIVSTGILDVRSWSSAGAEESLWALTHARVLYQIRIADRAALPIDDEVREVYDSDYLAPEGPYLLYERGSPHWEYGVEPVPELFLVRHP